MSTLKLVPASGPPVQVEGDKAMVGRDASADVVVGSASVTLKAGQSRIVKISLNGTGRRLLAKRHKLKVRLRVAQTFASAPGAAAIRPRTVSTQILTFKARKRHKHHH